MPIRAITTPIGAITMPIYAITMDRSARSRWAVFRKLGDRAPPAPVSGSSLEVKRIGVRRDPGPLPA